MVYMYIWYIYIYIRGIYVYMPDQHNLLQQTVHTAYYSGMLLDVSYAHFLVRGLHRVCGAPLISRFSTISCFYSASK